MYKRKDDKNPSARQLDKDEFDHIIKDPKTILFKKTSEKEFDAIKFMRQQRDKLSEKLSKMTNKEILEYFKNSKSDSSVKPCA
jgi:hypothetical protein